MHLHEEYADDDTYLRWVNSNLLLLHSLELLVTGVAKSHPGRQLLPAGALRGSPAPCILVHEIIPDAVACQYVDLGLHIPVVAACLADPYVDVGYGDQRLIFAKGPF